MNYEEIVKARYAAKKFTGAKIPEDAVHKLLEIVRMSPSSFGLQPWKIKIVTDQATKDALMAASWGQPQVGTASHVLVFCADTQIMPLVNKLEQDMLAAGATKEQISGYINMMKGFVEGLSPEVSKSWSQKQVYIALANALNAAKYLGFDSCPMEGFSPEEYSKILKLPAHLVPTVVCPIGVAADTPHPKIRFALKDILI